MRSVLILVMAPAVCLGQIDLDSLEIDLSEAVSSDELGDHLELLDLGSLPGISDWTANREGLYRQRVHTRNDQEAAQAQWFSVQNRLGRVFFTLERDAGEQHLASHRVSGIEFGNSDADLHWGLGAMRVYLGSGLLYSPGSMLASRGLGSMARLPSMKLKMHQSLQEFGYIRGAGMRYVNARCEILLGIGDARPVGEGKARGFNDLNALLGVGYSLHGLRCQLNVLNSPRDQIHGLELNLHHSAKTPELQTKFRLDLASSNIQKLQLNAELALKARQSSLGIRYYLFDESREKGLGISAGQWDRRGANEQGVGLHLRWRPAPRLSLESGIDSGRLLRPENTFESSTKTRLYTRIILKSAPLKLHMRYSQRSDPVNTGSGWNTGFRQVETHRLNCKLDYSPGSGDLRLFLGIVYASSSQHDGLGFHSRASCRISKSSRVEFGTQRFSIAEYDLRSYVYEPGVDKSFGLRLLYGDGQRTFLLLRHEAQDSYLFEMKLGQLRDFRMEDTSFDLTVQMSVVF